MNLGAVLITGLLAGGVSCAAVQGGLLAGLLARQRVGASTNPGPPAASTGVGARLRSLREQAGDDFLPVGAFLGAKLVSHALLGALLGAVGSAVQLAPGVRVWTQLAAGGLIIAFGLAQLQVGPFKRFVLEPPAAWSRFVRQRARSQAAFAPAVLGFFTILVPCGVTLSVEALALASGSALSGAAIMAVFVLGTSPLFAVLGYAARKAVGAWRGRLAIATGLVVLGLGLYTFNGGLTLMGSPLAARNLAETVGLVDPPPVSDPSGVAPAADGRQEVVVTARTGSYRPTNIGVKAGVPTTLVVRSQSANGCVRSFVIPSLNKQLILPVNGDTRIDLGTLAPGILNYTCGMGMYSGKLTITEQGS